MHSASTSSSSATIKKLTAEWSQTYSGIQSNLGNTIPSSSQLSLLFEQQRIAKLAALKKSAESIRHSSFSASASCGSANVKINTILLECNNDNNNNGNSAEEGKTTSATFPLVLGKIVQDVHGELCVALLNTSNQAKQTPTIFSSENIKLESDASSFANKKHNSSLLGSKQTENIHFVPGDVVAGTISTTDAGNIFVVSGVVIPSCCGYNALNDEQSIKVSFSPPVLAIVEEAFEILKNQFACLVPGVPLVTALILKESSSWSRIRMSLVDNLSLSSSSSSSLSLLSLIERLSSNAASNSSIENNNNNNNAKKSASIISDFLRKLSSSNSNSNHHQQQLHFLFKQERDLLRLAASIFADELADSVVERAGCTVSWWRQILLFASSPFFITHVLASFFLSCVLHRRNLHDNSSEQQQQQEVLDYLTNILHPLVSSVGKHVERMIHVIFSFCGELTLLGPMNLLPLAQEAVQSLSVIALVLKSWKELTSSSSSSSLSIHDSTNEDDAANEETNVHLYNNEDPQIELPSHFLEVASPSSSSSSWLRQAAADIYLTSPSTIIKTQICVVDAILRGVHHVVEKMSKFCQSNSNNNNNNKNNISSETLWFHPSQNILPMISDREVGSRPISAQLSKLEISLVEAIHSQSIQEAESANSTVLEKFIKMWSQQDAALHLLKSFFENDNNNRSTPQQLQQQQLLLSSLIQKLENTMAEILFENKNESSSAYPLRICKMYARLSSLQLLKTVSHLLLSQKILAVKNVNEKSPEVMSQLFLEDDDQATVGKNESNSGTEGSHASKISILLEPSCVGSWIENNLVSSLHTKIGPKLTLLNDPSSEFNGRLVLHGRLQSNLINKNKHEIHKSSLGLLVVCAADQNMWLLWFTVVAEIQLTSQNNNNNNNEQQGTALVINLLHHEASLAQALLGAAEMSRQALMSEQNKGQEQENDDEEDAANKDEKKKGELEQHAGSFCVFFNTTNHWIAAAVGQASMNGPQHLFATNSAKGLSIPISSLSSANVESSDDSSSSFNVTSSLDETLKTFENKSSFSLSKDQSEMVRASVLASSSSHQNNIHKSTQDGGDDSPSSQNNQHLLLVGHGSSARCGKTTPTIQSIAARSSVIQDSVSHRLTLPATRKILLPNPNHFKTAFLAAPSSSSKNVASKQIQQENEDDDDEAVNDTETNDDDHKSGETLFEVRKKFLEQLARFQQQSDEESPSLLICRSGDIASNSKELTRLLSTPSSSILQNNRQKSTQLDKERRIAHHFSASTARCSRAPFIQNLLHQQSILRKKLEQISQTLSKSSSYKLLFSDSRLEQVLSPNQFKILTESRREKAAHSQNNINNNMTMNKDLFKIFEFLTSSQDDGDDEDNEGDNFFDQDLADLISQQQTLIGSDSSAFGIFSVFPLPALENSFETNITNLNNNNNNNNSSATRQQQQQLSSDLSFLGRLDFAKPNSPITNQTLASISSALKYRCLCIIKREQEEIFSRFILISSQIRDFVESTTIQSIKSTPARILLCDSESDLVSNFNFLVSPFRISLRFISIDDIEESVTPLAAVSSCLIRSVVIPNWNKKLLSASSATQKNKLASRKNNGISSSVISLTCNSSLLVESIKLTCGKNIIASMMGQKSSSAADNLRFFTFPISVIQKLVLASEFHSVIQGTFRPMLEKLLSQQQTASSKENFMIRHISLMNEYLARESTNYYVNNLRKMILNQEKLSSAQQNKINNMNNNNEIEHNNNKYQQQLHPPTLLTNSLVRNISLWSIPLPNLNENTRHSSATNNNSGSNSFADSQSENIFLHRRATATKIFFKCISEAVACLSELSSANNGKNASSSCGGDHDEVFTGVGLVFVSENGNLLTISSSNNKSPLQLPSSSSSTTSPAVIKIFSNQDSINEISKQALDSLLLVVVPNSILEQVNSHKDGESSSSKLFSQEDFFFNFSACCTDSSSSASKLLVSTTGSIVCISTSEIFETALNEQNSIIEQTLQQKQQQYQNNIHNNNNNSSDDQQKQQSLGSLLCSAAKHFIPFFYASPSISSCDSTAENQKSSQQATSSSIPKSSVWIRQLIHAAHLNRAPTATSTSQQGNLSNSNNQAEADAIFYGNNNHQASTTFLDATGNSLLLQKSYGPALEISCPRHQLQCRGFLLFAVNSGLFLTSSSIAVMKAVVAVGGNQAQDGDDLLLLDSNNNHTRDEQSQKTLLKALADENKLYEAIAGAQFLNRLLPNNNSNNNNNSTSSSSSCSGLCGCCQLVCLAKYQGCSVKSHMCLESCHELNTKPKKISNSNRHDDDDDDVEEDSHHFHLLHKISCPFICGKTLPCGHRCAQNCGSPCQCPFSNTPVVVLERRCGESCIIGVDAAKNPTSKFYCHKVIVPCSGFVAAATNSADAGDDLLPPCQENVELNCQHCGNVISCSCCDVESFRVSDVGGENEQNLSSSSSLLMCNICRDIATRPQGAALTKLKDLNLLLAKRTGLMATAAQQRQLQQQQQGNGNNSQGGDEELVYYDPSTGSIVVAERVKKILRRHEALKIESEKVVKSAQETISQANKRDIGRAIQTQGQQAQLRADLAAYRVQNLNIVRKNV